MFYPPDQTATWWHDREPAMRCLMSLNQREAVLSAIPPEGDILEWGSGGTTLWMLDRLATGQHLVSVEHNAQWGGQLLSEAGRRANWTMLQRPGALEVGSNATQWEECPAGLGDYIDQPVGKFDTFLIDGVARGACLMNVLMKARPGATVFLHDTQRDWYGWAMAAGAARIASRETIAPTPGDYPSLMTRLVLR